MGAKPAEGEGRAVMYFENRSPGARWQWLSTGLADMLITDLGRSERPLVVAVLPGLGHVLVAEGPPPGLSRHSDHALGSQCWSVLRQSPSAGSMSWMSLTCGSENSRCQADRPGGRAKLPGKSFWTMAVKGVVPTGAGPTGAGWHGLAAGVSVCVVGGHGQNSAQSVPPHHSPRTQRKYLRPGAHPLARGSGVL